LSLTLFSGANLIDGSGAAPRRESLLVEGERIAALGVEAEQHAAAAGSVTRVALAGATLMPGLVDAHCHVTFDEPVSNDELFFHRRPGLAALIAAFNVRKLLLAGVTSFLDADTIFDLGVDLRDAIESGAVLGPRMATGAHALMTSVGGTAGRLIPDDGERGYARVVGTRDEIVREVRRQIKLGVDWVKVHATGLVPRQREQGEIQVWTLEELRTVVSASHDLGVPVVAHCRNSSSTRDCAIAGVDLILHATFMQEDALAAVVARKVPLVPTLTFQANLAEHGAKVGSDPALMDVFRREIVGSAGALRRAHDAGVPLLCGSESGFSLTPYGHWHWRELEVFVKHLGLSPLEAIRAATANGAIAMRKPGEIGVLAPGAYADLIAIDGDPSADVAVLGRREKLRGVWKGGAAIDLAQPWPVRAPTGGERVSLYSKRVLTRAVAEE
jgi:imidazolonepropionase-like amidohydrolase